MPALGLLWPPNLLSHLLFLLARPCENLFYRADLCAAYDIFSTTAVYLSAWLNAIVKTTPLNDQLDKLATSSARERLGPANRILLTGYLRGYFLLPNLLGPIRIWWWQASSSGSAAARLDELAHLYGFVIGVLHAPLLAALLLRVVLPLICASLYGAVVGVSRAAYVVSGCVPDDPAAVAQRGLRALQVRLERLPRDMAGLVDSDVLQAEGRFVELSIWFLALVNVCVLSTAVVDLWKTHLERFVLCATAKVLMFAGDWLFDFGRWVETFVIKRGTWAGVGSWQLDL